MRVRLMSGELGDARRHGVIVLEHVLPTPAVERKPCCCDVTGAVDEEDGSRIAEPDVAEGDAMEHDTEPRERGTSLSLGALIGDEHVERLAAWGRSLRIHIGEGLAQRRESLLRRGQVLEPELSGRGPCGPGSGVRGPFSGLMESVHAGGIPREPCGCPFVRARRWRAPSFAFSSASLTGSPASAQPECERWRSRSPGPSRRWWSSRRAVCPKIACNRCRRCRAGTAARTACSSPLHRART
jgi:hypothetical protein